jgi:hypothetical protein
LKHYLYFAFALTAPLFAGVRIQIESVEVSTGDVTKREILVDADRIRMNESGKKDHNSVLFLTDGGRNRLVMLDNDKGEYRELDQQTIDQMSGQVSAAAAQMQAQMKDMTPEQRAMVEQMMKGRGIATAPAASTAARTVFTAKGSGTANGFACTKYDITRGGENVGELCAASPAAMRLSDADFKAYDKMKDLLTSMLNMSSAILPNSVSMATLGQNGYSGFPVQQITIKDGKITDKTDTRSVGRASFSNDDFSLGEAKQVDFLPGAPKQLKAPKQVKGKQR